MINLKKGPGLKSMLFFAGYLFLCSIVHIILVSIIAFFHFNLGHDLSLIEEWIFYQGWEIILTTKILSAFVILKFINQNTLERRPNRKLFLSRIVQPSSEFMVIIFVLFFCLLFFGRPLYSEHYNFSFIKSLLSYIGVFSFFFIDLFILEMIAGETPPKGDLHKLLSGIIFAGLFWMAGKMTYTYSADFNMMVYFNFFICYQIMYFKLNNFTGPILYLLLFVAPINILFGMDPIWLEHYSFFVMSSKIEAYYYIILASLIVTYLSYKKRSSLWDQQN